MRATHKLAVAALGSLLFFGPATEAKVIYTAANVAITNSGSLNINLNHDGRTDFMIWALTKAQSCYGNGSGQLIHMVTAMPGQGNGVIATGGNAAALYSGAQIDASQSFSKYQTVMAKSVFSRGCGPSLRQGYWLIATNRYLGLEFLINGQIHYGWAELTVTTPFSSGVLSVILVGYAYETIPGKALKAGQSSG